MQLTSVHPFLPLLCTISCGKLLACLRLSYCLAAKNFGVTLTSALHVNPSQSHQRISIEPEFAEPIFATDLLRRGLILSLYLPFGLPGDLGALRRQSLTFNKSVAIELALLVTLQDSLCLLVHISRYVALH